MLRGIFVAFMFLPLLGFAQNLTNTSAINISKSWSQEPGGYTYPMDIRVPTGAVPQDGFPLCILLHGNGGNGTGMVTQFQNILTCHALVAPTGYENSWNLCAENSDAPDVEMVEDLVNILQTYSNINPNQIRILGFSNGAGLANQVYIQNSNPGVDIIGAVVSQLNEPQFHLNDFYKPSGVTEPTDSYCGYDTVSSPLQGRKYLSICNDNDPVIPYEGGTSVVGVDFVDAQDAAYYIAQGKGYTGTQLPNAGIPTGTPVVFEYSYLSGEVVHIRGNAQHGMNPTQRDYIKDFFEDCVATTSIYENTIEQVKVYPNPFTSSIIIEQAKASYSIMDNTGRVVLKGNIDGVDTHLELLDLPPGIYFLKTGEQTIKLIKKD